MLRKIGDQKADSLASILAVTDPHLLCKAGKEQDCQVLRVSTAVASHAASEECVREVITALLGQKAV